MQLLIPDCCAGETCPGAHVEGHCKRDDGTYYSRDNIETNAYHYHNTDGSVFYRYSDGSEYYRRKDGKIRFKYPKDTPEEAGEAGPASPPSPTMEDRTTCPWTDWPPKLHLSVETRGSSFVIRGTSGSVITFEPVGPDVKADPTPPHGGSVPPPDRSQYQPTHDPTSAVQEWLRMQTILSRGYD